jgi:hypothetical protein
LMALLMTSSLFAPLPIPKNSLIIF